MMPAGGNGDEYSLRPKAISNHAMTGERHARPPFVVRGDKRPRLTALSIYVTNGERHARPPDDAHVSTKVCVVRGEEGVPLLTRRLRLWELRKCAL
jgi:hypothetical protein